MVAPAPHRAAILDAALGCFLAKSVSATTVDDIRKHSGASVGSIYHFFGSKNGRAAQQYLDTLATRPTNASTPTSNTNHEAPATTG